MLSSWLDALPQTALAVTGLLGLVLLTRRAVARRFGAQAAYALWSLPVLRFVMPPVMLPATWSLGLERVWDRPEPVMADPIGQGGAVYAPNRLPNFTSPLSPPETANVDLSSALLLIWLIGIVVGLIWLIIRHHHHMTDWRTRTYPLDQKQQQDVTRVATLAGLKYCPEVRIARDDQQFDSGPVVSGLIYPLIVLPERFDRLFTAEQRRLALLHEMTHVRRGDLWTAAAMMTFRLLNWPNPLMHWAWPRFRADQEAACDAAVLKITGETRRADYAETLLLAAKTYGRAGPSDVTGLALSLNHPIKERLMILGSNTQEKRRVGQWTLGLLLLAGTALCAPVGFAADGDGKTVTTKTSTVRIIETETDGKSSHYEIREEDGTRTYFRVGPDGAKTELTQDEFETEFEAEYDGKLDSIFPGDGRIELRRLTGKSGLRTFPSDGSNDKTVREIILKNRSDKDVEFDIEVEDGVKRFFQTDENGVRTEITIDHFFDKDMDEAPFVVDGKNIQFFSTDKSLHEWIDDDGTTHSFVFGTSDASGPAMAEARLRSTQSMLKSSEHMISMMRADAEGSAERDLRDAEKQLEKAQKALERAREAVSKSKER